MVMGIEVQMKRRGDGWTMLDTISREGTVGGESVRSSDMEANAILYPQYTTTRHRRRGRRKRLRWQLKAIVL